MPTPRAGRKVQPRGASDSSHPPKRSNLHAISPWPGLARSFPYDYRVKEFGLLDVLGGAHRPARTGSGQAHFDAVLTVVLKLLQSAAAERAYSVRGVAAGGRFAGPQQLSETDRQARRTVLTLGQPRRAATRTVCRWCQTRRPPR